MTSLSIDLHIHIKETFIYHNISCSAMTEVTATARKWGDSIAIIIPKEVVREEHIGVDDTIHLILNKEKDLTGLFGKLRIKKSAQQLKNESKKSWS